MSELYHPRHLSPVLWSIAGIVAIALHAGGVGLAFVSKQADSEPDLGAPAIEIGIELAAPKLEPTDLPVGPDTEAAAPSPAMVEQKAVIEHTDLPKATPTETDDPDRVVSPNETEKPKEEEPKVTTMPTQASTPSIAAEATASPTLQEAPEATHSIAPRRAPARARGARKRPGKRSSPPTSTNSSATRPSGSHRAPRSWSALCWIGWDMSSPSASLRDRAMRPSTRRRSICCSAPIRCRPRRRSWPTTG